MPTHGFCIASLSDVGRVRERNEDAFREFRNGSGLQLLVVADGMGGHRAGATASCVTADTIGEIFQSQADEPEALLRIAVESANARVFDMARQDVELRGMGTTAVALLLSPEGRGWVAHVGDSRVYCYRDSHLDALTRDHSVVAELERRGLITAEQAAVHPRRNEILRSVGVEARVDVEVSAIEVLHGDTFLLCSDGLSGMLDETEIAVILDENTPAEAARLLVERANEHGGHDNVTVQVVEIVETGEVVGGASAGSAREEPAGEQAGSDSGRRRRTLVLAAAALGGLGLLALLLWLR